MPDQHNFWFWFLSGLLDMIDNFMVQLPLYQHSGMAVLFYNALLGVLTVFALYFGTFLNLCWFVAMLILFLTSEGTRGFMAAYRTLVKLIPLP